MYHGTKASGNIAASRQHPFAAINAELDRYLAP
jgi:hypothetical protein